MSRKGHRIKHVTGLRAALKRSRALTIFSRSASVVSGRTHCMSKTSPLPRQCSHVRQAIVLQARAVVSLEKEIAAKNISWTQLGRGIGRAR